jgi:hypothetical protein
MAKGRLLDDVAPFDRAFRLIAARRNVYVWILACGFLLDAFPQSYAVICGWAALVLPFISAFHLDLSWHGAPLCRYPELRNDEKLME